MRKKHGKTLSVCVIIHFLFLLLPFTLPALQSAEEHVVPKFRFSDVERWVKRFEDPKREEWQKPDEVVKALHLQPGDSVVDIGAGTGYFTRRFAQAVLPGGVALGLDIEHSLVNYMKEDARKLNLTNYDAKVVMPDDPELEPQSADVVFLCNTYHHIDNRTDYFRRISKSLKPGGRVVVVDYYKKEMPEGPPQRHKLSKEAVLQEFKEAGYRLLRSHDFLPYQYFLEFVVN